MMNEQAKRKFYKTLYRFGITNLSPTPLSSNIYIDDSGFVMIIQPDGVIYTAGELSLTGEFVCTDKTKMV